jgi:hypothetical protein
MLTFEEMEKRLGPAEVLRRKRAYAGQKGAKARQVHRNYILVGGPLDGQTVSLSGPSTGVMSIGAYFGRYTQAQHLASEKERPKAARKDNTWIKEHRSEAYPYGPGREPVALQLHWDTL